MNIFNKVTLQSLKKNKARTIVTIIGIMLSAAMICAVTTFASSIKNYALQNAIYNKGDWHGNVSNTDVATYEKIKNSGQVAGVVYSHQIGYAVAKDCKNQNKPYIYLIGTSQGFENMMPIHVTAGRYPASTTEILLPNHLAENGGVRHSIGEELVLQIGDRMNDGYLLDQSNPFYTYDENRNTIPIGEEFVERETRTYTVVGFYERPTFEEYTAPGYTAITVADVNLPSSARYDIYYKLKNAKEIYDFTKINNIEGGKNTSVLIYSGISEFDSLDSILTGLSAIVIGLIMFGSVSLIYNAFSISVSERTKQFGLLSSIGATKKQLRRMVLSEALMVSAVGVPLGIFVGIGGIGITLMLIGHRFETISGFPIPLRMSVSVEAIIIAIIIALITVLISAWIPSKRATRISAVQAIRQNVDIIAKRKQIKTSKLIYKLFGLPGMLANKHYKRSRKKYRATIISLFMSIVLFVSASAFTDYLMESAKEGFSTNSYDIIYYCDKSDFTDITEEQLLEALKNDTSVTNVAYTQTLSFIGNIDTKYLTKQALSGISSGIILPQNSNSTTASTHTIICFVNDVEFRQLLKKYNLDEKTFMNPENPLAVTINDTTFYNSTEEKYVKMNILNSDNSQIKIDLDAKILGYEEITLKSGKLIYEKPFYYNYDNECGPMFIYPASLKSAVIPGLNEENHSFNYFITTDNHKVSYKALKETLSENGFKQSSLINYAERADESRNLVLIIKVFAFGFIILISLIAAANVFNTISTNISLRRREFAMLKSVGMSSKAFNKMMNFECLLYGSKALIYGLPVSSVISYLIFIVISEGYSTDFRLPYTAIGIAVLSVFAVVFATMMYSMSKIKRDNPIDAMKNENL